MLYMNIIGEHSQPSVRYAMLYSTPSIAPINYSIECAFRKRFHIALHLGLLLTCIRVSAFVRFRRKLANVRHDVCTCWQHRARLANGRMQKERVAFDMLQMSSNWLAPRANVLANGSISCSLCVTTELQYFGYCLCYIERNDTVKCSPVSRLTHASHADSNTEKKRDARNKNPPHIVDWHARRASPTRTQAEEQSTRL